MRVLIIPVPVSPGPAMNTSTLTPGCRSLPLAQSCGTEAHGAARWWWQRRHRTPAPWSVRGDLTDGPGPYPCSPNEARRAGCRAMPPLSSSSSSSSLPPSLTDPEPGQLWARSHVSRRCPCEKLLRWRDTTAPLGSSVQRCVHQLRLHPPPPLPPHRAALLLLVLRAAGARLTPCIPSLCMALRCSHSLPTSSHQSRQMHRIWLGRACSQCQCKRRHLTSFTGGWRNVVVHIAVEWLHAGGRSEAFSHIASRVVGFCW